MNELDKILKALSTAGGALKLPLEGVITAAIELAKLNRETMSEENLQQLDAVIVKSIKRADDIWEFILWEIGLLPAVERAKAARGTKD